MSPTQAHAHAAGACEGGRGPLRAESPSEHAAACGLAAEEGAWHKDAACVPGTKLRDERGLLGALGGSRNQPRLARFPAPALGQADMCPLRESLEVLPHRPSARIEAAFHRRGGERAGGPRTQSSASRSPRSPPEAQPIAASGPSIAASDESAFCAGRDPAPSCPPSAGRATRTPAAVANKHPPSPKRRAQSDLSARALLGRARGGRGHGLGLRQARRRVGRYERPLPAGSLRGAAGFLAEPVRLPRPGRALAEGRLNAGSGWFPCGTSTATKVVNGSGAQRVAEPLGTSSELGNLRGPGPGPASPCPRAPRDTQAQPRIWGPCSSRYNHRLPAERSWRRPSNWPGGTGITRCTACEESERDTVHRRPR